MPTSPLPTSTPGRRPAARWWTREDILLLILLGVLFLLPGLGKITLFDRDEPRFATAARTMLQTGDFIVPHFNGALRPDKPPLVYWLMDLASTITGNTTELAARLPSAICGIGTLVIIYFMVGVRFGRVTGLLAAIILGTSALFLVVSRMATADGTMLLCITACMACAWQAWDAAPPVSAARTHLPRTDYLLDRSGTNSPLMLDYLPASTARPMPLLLALVFWFALAAGTLAKGVPLLFVLIPMVILSLATGQLPAQLAQWRSHFHLTKGRVGAAFAIAGIVTIYEITAFSAHVWPEGQLWSAILGTLLIAMLLLPGLPGILVRCFAGANWRWWRQLRPLIGIPLLIVLVSWWFILAGQSTDWVLIKDMVGVHFLNRTIGPLLNSIGIHITASADPTKPDPLKNYSEPPGFYLLTVWGTFWPWSILIIPAAYHAVRRLMKKTALAIDPRPYQFLVAWIVPMWILLELARGKLFHYPLPLFVPLAILCADTLVQSWYRLTEVLSASWFQAMRWVTLFIWLGMGTAVLVAAKKYLDDEWLYRCLPFAAALMATGFASAMTWGRQTWPFALVLAWGGALLIANIVILPDLPMLQVSRLLGKKMAEMKQGDPNTHLAARGYQEGSLVFYAGSNIEMIDTTDDLMQTFAPHWRLSRDQAFPSEMPRYVIAVDDATLAELDQHHIQYYTFYTLPRVTGINTGNLKPVAVTLITNLPLPGPSTSATATSPSTAAATSPTQPEPTTHPE